MQGKLSTNGFGSTEKDVVGEQVVSSSGRSIWINYHQLPIFHRTSYFGTMEVADADYFYVMLYPRAVISS